LLTAGVLFDDGSVAVSRQDKGLEYGCTVDAVTKLCAAIEGSGEAQGAATQQQQEQPRPRRKPLVVMQVDQLGICHAPHAKGRSWLYEQGHGDVTVYVHHQAGTSAQRGVALGAGGAAAALHRTTVERLSPAVPLIALK
jgi:hypothetical protein